MSDTKHTPEPWELKTTEGSDHKLCTIYSSKAGRGIARHVLPEDASRIVACVNACKGYTNDELEYGMIEKEREAEMAWERAMMAAIGEDGIKSVSEAIAKLKAERDELLAALETFRGSLYFERNTEQAKRLTIAAIAKARGTA